MKHSAWDVVRLGYSGFSNQKVSTQSTIKLQLKETFAIFNLIFPWQNTVASQIKVYIRQVY